MNKGKTKRTVLIYTAVTVFTLVFGQVYEVFSFGVTSPFMHFAFLIPLLLGVLPCLVLLTAGNRVALPEGCGTGWHLGVATLTAGSLFRGVLDIYGTQSSLMMVYPAAGFACFASSLLQHLRAQLRKEAKAEVNRGEI